jgi:tetratricopeptide (TPR) repeat protein
VINNNSDRLTLTSGTPLTLGEGYELAIKSIDIDGNKVYVELSKNGNVIDSTIIIPPAPVLHNKGIALFYQGKYGEAISAFDKAIEIDPQYAAAWTSKGNALDKLGKYDEAIESYNKASEIDANLSTNMLSKGNSHYEAGEYIAAIRYYDEVVCRYFCKIVVVYPRHGRLGSTRLAPN